MNRKVWAKKAAGDLAKHKGRPRALVKIAWELQSVAAKLHGEDPYSHMLH
jgi:hypothetical protein